MLRLFFFVFLFTQLSSRYQKTAESIKLDRYVKSTIILSYNRDSLIGEMTRVFGPYEARVLESVVKEYLPKNWHDPKAKVEIYYINTQRSKIIQYVSFLGSGKKIEIIFKDFEKCVIVEDAPSLIRLEIDPQYSFDVYKLPKTLSINIHAALKKLPKTKKNYKTFKKLFVYYSAENFVVKAIVLVNNNNTKQHCIFFNGLVFNKNGFSLQKKIFPRYFGLNTKTIITSRFGYRYHPVWQTRCFHSGVDLKASTGTLVHSVHDGRVVFRGWIRGYGNCIKIAHGQNVISLYGHLSRFSSSVKLGAFVKRGSLIGYSGSTGFSTAPHLHFEIRVRNRPVDPMKFRFSRFDTVPQYLLEDFRGLVKEIDSIPND